MTVEDYVLTIESLYPPAQNNVDFLLGSDETGENVWIEQWSVPGHDRPMLPDLFDQVKQKISELPDQEKREREPIPQKVLSALIIRMSSRWPLLPIAAQIRYTNIIDNAARRILGSS